MNNKEKHEVAFRLSTGASCGLTFLEDYLDANEHTDIAFVRSICMLLSYNVELLLKSRVVMLGSYLNENDLKNKLMGLSHNLVKIKDELSVDELSNIGIKEIIKNDTQYIIKTIKNTEIKTEDFIDIRYDYIFGKTRTVSGGEYDEIKKYLVDLFEILKFVKTKNEETV